MKIFTVPGNLVTPKSYPHWDRFLELAKGHDVHVLNGMLTIPEIIDQVNWCDVWISIDSFLPHLVAYYKLKPGIVIWGLSDPLIFGHPENVNLLKDRKYLRSDQFHWWKDQPNVLDAFVEPEIIMREVERIQHELAPHQG